MLAVVVDRMQGDPAALARAAAEVLGGTPYDVRAAMNVPEGGPAVLLVTTDAGLAGATRAGLEHAGFTASLVEVKQPRPRIEARRFEFGGSALAVEDRQGVATEVQYAAIELLLRATAVTQSSTTATVKERKFSLAHSALTGGLINTTVKRSQQTTRSTDSDEVLYVFAGGGPPLRLSEHELQYQGLGAATQPSRAANFQYTVTELHRRAPGASFDERLRRRAVQSQMLGHTLSPDEHLEFAVDLIASSRRG